MLAACRHERVKNEQPLKGAMGAPWRDNCENNNEDTPVSPLSKVGGESRGFERCARLLWKAYSTLSAPHLGPAPAPRRGGLPRLRLPALSLDRWQISRGCSGYRHYYLQKSFGFRCLPRQHSAWEADAGPTEGYPHHYMRIVSGPLCLEETITSAVFRSRCCHTSF